MKDKTYSDEFITQPLETKEVDLPTKLMNCNNTSLTTNLARLDVKNGQPEAAELLHKVNSVYLTETSTSSISSTVSSSSSATSQANPKTVDCGDVQVELAKSQSECDQLNSETSNETGTNLNENELKVTNNHTYYLRDFQDGFYY